MGHEAFECNDDTYHDKYPLVMTKISNWKTTIDIVIFPFEDGWLVSWLVVDKTPLKNRSSSIGMITFQNYMGK